MDEKLMEIAFGIIAHAGDAKSKAFEAISTAKQGEVEKALEMIKEADNIINQAHRFQTELITKEASGEELKMGVILVHSQDHLMTSMTFIQLAKEIVEVYSRL